MISYVVLHTDIFDRIRCTCMPLMHPWWWACRSRSMYEGHQRQRIITDLRSVILNTVWCKSSVVFISSNICRVSRSLLYCTDCVWIMFSLISKLHKGSGGLCVCPVVTNNIQFGRQPPVQAVSINSILNAWYDAGVRMLVPPRMGESMATFRRPDGSPSSG